MQQLDKSGEVSHGTYCTSGHAMQAPWWCVTGLFGELCKAVALHSGHDTHHFSRIHATKQAVLVQDEEGEVVGARVKDVLQKKQQDVYARQVSNAKIGTVQSIRVQIRPLR